jgi:hypothetical protein
LRKGKADRCARDTRLVIGGRARFLTLDVTLLGGGKTSGDEMGQRDALPAPADVGEIVRLAVKRAALLELRARRVEIPQHEVNLADVEMRRGPSARVVARTAFVEHAAVGVQCAPVISLRGEDEAEPFKRARLPRFVHQTPI